MQSLASDLASEFQDFDLEEHLRFTFERLTRGTGALDPNSAPLSAQAHGEPLEQETPPNLADAISYSFLSPGKRIRPRLLLACGQMLGLPTSQLLPAATALEMIHCFTLIHDDLPCMDDDDYRRGMLSNHKKFGEGLALLAGDGLLALAMEAFLDSPVSSDALIRGLKRLTWAAGPRGVIGGQAREELLNERSGLRDVKRLHRMKTGALFSAAILIPKDFAAISDDSPEGMALREFADALGLSFQIVDDLEDHLNCQDVHNDLTNILTYVSPQEAQTLAQEPLTLASQKLAHIWGTRSQTLTQIAEKVIQKC